MNSVTSVLNGSFSSFTVGLEGILRGGREFFFFLVFGRRFTKWQLIDGN